MTIYTIHAWCLRPFITTIDIEANTPADAIAKARLETSKLLDAAEECNNAYPWDEFSVYADDGTEILHWPTESPDGDRTATVLHSPRAHARRGADWDIFDCDGVPYVQRMDDARTITDDQAIAAARESGMHVANDGRVIHTKAEVELLAAAEYCMQLDDRHISPTLRKRLQEAIMAAKGCAI